VQFAAGTPDPSDIRGNTVDLEASAFRELGEEMGLGAPLVSAQAGWTIVTEGSRLAFMKDMRIALGTAATLARATVFIASEPEPELRRVLALHSPAGLAGLNMSGFMQAYLKAQWAAQSNAV
jgi:hypothetical protein